jgi:hypothetical protein
MLQGLRSYQVALYEECGWRRSKNVSRLVELESLNIAIEMPRRRRYWLQSVRCFVYKLKGGRDGSSMCNAMTRKSLSASMQFLLEIEMAGLQYDTCQFSPRLLTFSWELPSQPHCLPSLMAGQPHLLICTKRVAWATPETLQALFSDLLTSFLWTMK